MKLRFLSVLLCLCILASLCLPALADDYVSEPVGFWDYLFVNSNSNAYRIGDFFGLFDPGWWTGITGYLAAEQLNAVCDQSSDGLHHCTDLTDMETGHDDYGYYALLSCDRCGRWFRCYDSDFTASYNEGVEDLEEENVTTSFSSSSSSEFNFIHTSSSFGVYWTQWRCQYCSDSSSVSDGNYGSFDSSHLSFSFDLSSLTTVSASNSYFNCSFSVEFPCSGTLTFDFITNAVLNGSSYSYSESVYFNPPSNYSYPYVFNFTKQSRSSSQFGVRSLTTGSYSCSISNVVFTPDDPSSYTPSGGVSIPSTVHVDIENNTFYSPTNITYNFTDYSYDFSDRSYHITLDNSDTVVITYGDQYISYIDPSGDTYYYYYTFDLGGSPGLIDAADLPDYTIVLRDLSHKISELVSKTESIRLTDVEIQALLASLDVTSSQSARYLRLIYDSLQLIQTDQNTCADNTTLILGVARDILSDGQLTRDELDDLEDKLDFIISTLYDNEAAASWLAKIYEKIDSMGLDEESGTGGWFSDLLGDVLGTFGGNVLSNLFDGLSDGISDIVGNMAGELVDDLLPDVDFGDVFDEAASPEAGLTGYIIGIYSSFEFVWQVQEIIENFITDILSDASGASSPSVVIYFGDSNKYGVDWANLGAIDLSWYAPLKPRVDGIVSSFLWIGYFWLLFKRLPGIISGSALASEDGIKIARS